MYTNIIILKLDNGYKARITDYLTPLAVNKGTELMNRGFKGTPSGSYALVTINISRMKRRMVKRVKVIADSAELNDIRTKYSFIAVAHLGTTPKKAVFAAVNESSKEEVKSMPKVEVKAKKASALDGYFINVEARSTFTTALQMSKKHPDKAVKVMMVGPSGYGKTTLPQLLAQVTGKRFLRMNCATIRDPEEWFGYREAKEGSTLFIRSQFATEMEKGELVLVLDEFNRLEPWLHNTLFPLLDDDGYTVVHDEMFSMGSGVIVVATINTGFKYTGTFELDEALFNRFDFTLEVGPMPYENEVMVLTKRTGIGSDVSEVVKMASVLRDNGVICSTRTTLLISKMIVAGLDIRSAFESAVVRRIPVDSGGAGLRKQVIDLINARFGAYNSCTPANDVFGDAPKVEVKVEAVEEEAKVAGATITLQRDVRLGAFLNIQVIKAIRSLPTLTPLSLKEAKDLSDALFNHEKLTLELFNLPPEFAVLGEQFKSYGVDGKFTIKVV